MKEKLKELWGCRPRLGRRGRTARNLLLALALAALIWGQFGYPLPTAEMEFRRLERTSLLPRSEIVLAPPTYRSDLTVSGEDRTFVARDGTELTLCGRWFVGVTEDRATAALVGGDRRNRMVSAVPLAETGPTLVPLVDGGGDHARGYWVEEGPMEGGYHYDYHNFSALLLLDVPEETARTELSTTDEEGTPYLGTGWDLEDGRWLVGFEAGDGHDRVIGWRPDQPYTLRLYGLDGSLLLEQSGTIPRAEGWGAFG